MSSAKLETVRRWKEKDLKFKCLGYELDADGLVSKIFCKTCREYFMDDDGNIRHSASLSGSSKDMSLTYINGTKVIKKNNCVDHVVKNKDHEKAVRLLKERELLSNNSNASEPEVCSGQSSIHYHVCKLNQRQHTQLQRKFQLAHYIAANAK